MKALLLALPIIALCAGAAAADANPAHCVRDGVPSICRSAEIEFSAAIAIARKCLRCRAADIRSAIDSMQINEGPYDDADELAATALPWARVRN
jgi:hypothetical protein